jgi:6-phosphogluconolactonase
LGDAPRFIRSTGPERECGRVLAAAILDADAASGSARVAIPGGSALAAIGAARPHLGDAWPRLRLTWVDERCVPSDRHDSNRGAAYRAGLLDDAHPPAVELPLYAAGESGPDAVARVEAGLAADFDDALDVLLLGLGEDGHIASIFPGAVFPDGAQAAWVCDSPKPPLERITLTPCLLATARASLILATGEGKRNALERLRDRDPAQPASALHNLTVVTDLDFGDAT